MNSSNEWNEKMHPPIFKHLEGDFVEETMPIRKETNTTNSSNEWNKEEPKFKLYVNGNQISGSDDVDSYDFYRNKVKEFYEDMNWSITYKGFSCCSHQKPQAEQALANSAPYLPEANTLLEQAAKHMRDRAPQYDAAATKERSMAKTVSLFNILCGQEAQSFQGKSQLRESEGWLFMVLLKLVRSESKDKPHQDSIEDLIAYASLYGEARMAGK